MANYYTSLAFKIAANRKDADQFIALIAAVATTQDGTIEALTPDLETAFASDLMSPAALLSDLTGGDFGINCHFDETSQSLTIFDSDGAPNLWALAQSLQRLYPAKLPLGFAYAETCDKQRAGGFGGGIFVIASDSIFNETLAQRLEEELTELSEPSDDKS